MRNLETQDPILGSRVLVVRGRDLDQKDIVGQIDIKHVGEAKLHAEHDRFVIGLAALSLESRDDADLLTVEFRLDWIDHVPAIGSNRAVQVREVVRVHGILDGARIIEVVELGFLGAVAFVLGRLLEPRHLWIVIASLTPP
jgi:hypothetical protein